MAAGALCKFEPLRMRIKAEFPPLFCLVPYRHEKFLYESERVPGNAAATSCVTVPIFGSKEREFDLSGWSSAGRAQNTRDVSCSNSKIHWFAPCFRWDCWRRVVQP